MNEMKDLDSVLEEVRAERCYACDKWGNDFDDQNTLNDWVSYITQYAGDSSKFMVSEEEAYNKLKKVANLAISAMLAYNRNGGWKPRHYE